MYPGIDKTFEVCLSKLRPVYGLATINATERVALQDLERKCFDAYDSEEINVNPFKLGGGMPMTLGYRKDLWERIQSTNHELGGKFRGLLTNTNIPEWPEGVMVVKEYSRKPEDEGDGLPW